MVEEREQERIAMDQLREELEQIGEWAQKAQNRVQGAEERVQRLALATEQKPGLKYREYGSCGIVCLT